MKLMINDFQAGNKIRQAVIVRVQKVGTSSNGGMFARGMLDDNSGRIPFICFEGALVDKLRVLEVPTALMISGAVDINKFSADMALQVIVQRVEELVPEDEMDNLLPRGNFDLEEYKARLAGLLRGIRTPVLKVLLDSIFSGSLYDKFIVNPAGTRMHHAYLGGLLQHSVDAAGIALAIAEQVGGVDRDLIVAGSLLHDIGKLKEISPQLGFPYTGEGRLLGHISMAALLVQEAALKLKIPSAQLEQLLHVLLAHHGENEKGSPVACATREAFIVHYADEIDAVMNQFSAYSGKPGWDFNKMLQRYLLQPSG